MWRNSNEKKLCHALQLGECKWIYSGKQRSKMVLGQVKMKNKAGKKEEEEK